MQPCGVMIAELDGYGDSLPCTGCLMIGSTWSEVCICMERGLGAGRNAWRLRDVAGTSLTDGHVGARVSRSAVTFQRRGAPAQEVGVPGVLSFSAGPPPWLQAPASRWRTMPSTDYRMLTSGFEIL
jgi:hypothetical protein